MQTRILAVLLLAAAPAAGGTWTRTDPATLTFEGAIEWGEYEKFLAAFDGSVRELVVTSPGGSAEDGVKIGLVLAANDVKVTVVGQCVSSCANYLFVGGHRRQIRGGIVGFHGNIKGCDTPEHRAKETESMRRQGASDQTIRETFAREKTAMLDEARFLAMMAVDQALFDRTCTEDKGMKDGKTYVFLLPTRTTFEKYRIFGVVGDQDPTLIKRLPYPVIVD